MRFASALPSAFMKYFPLFLGLLVLFIYFTFVYFIFIGVSEQTSMECGFVGVGTVCIIMVLWSLYRTSTVDPGLIPKHTMQSYDETKFRDYCLSCAIKRPERSHHCSKCRRCILNMDHHCIWTSNCIGLFNRKYFLLILFWGCFGMTQAMLLGGTNIDKLWKNAWSNDPKPLITRLLDIFILVMTGSQFMNALGLFYFFWKNLKLILMNICTLDEMILEMEATSQRRYHLDLTVYDLGIRYNLQFYFGKNPLTWLLPIGKPLGDGYYWDKNTSDSELVETTIQE